MSVTAAALRELHRIHQQLAELRDRLERGPKQVRVREANVAQLDARLAEARDKAKQTQMAVDRKQLDLKAGEQKVVDLRVKLNQANSNREYQSFLEQIAAAEMAGSVLSDEILEGMERVDQLNVGVKEAEKNLAAGKQEMDKAKQAVQASAASTHTDITRLEAELEAAEKALPSDLKADYERVVREGHVGGQGCRSPALHASPREDARLGRRAEPSYSPRAAVHQAARRHLAPHG